MIWRASQFNELKQLADVPEMPLETILHVLDNFQMVDPPSMAPRPDNPIINLNDHKKFVVHVTGPAGRGEEPLIPFDTKGIIFPSAGLLTALAAYKRANMPGIRILNSITEMPERAVTIDIVNYNPLYRARVTGMRRRMKFMAFMLATIMNKLVEAPNRQHFIHIPLAAMRFEKKHFMRVFKQMDKVSLVYPEIPQYLFLAHFYAIIANRNIKVDDKPVVEMTKEEEDEANAAMEGWQHEENELTGLTDADFLSYLRSYEMGKMEDEVVGAMEAFETWQNFNSSIFELLPTQYWDKVNFIFTAGDSFLAYNLKTLKQLNGRSNALLLRLMNQINRLADRGAEGVVTEDEADIAQEELVTVNTNKDVPNTPGFTKPLPEVDQTEFAAKDVEELDKAAETAVEKTSDLTKAQATHAVTVSKKYKEIKIGGEPIGELLSKPAEIHVEDNELPFIKEEVPMPDMTGSTIETLDQVYTQRVFKKDLAAVATSFAPQGMFLTDVEEKTVSDAMNDLKEYVFRYEDSRHKNHTIRFTIPNIDETGRCLVNGSIKSLSKQRISNPICKVSPTRVTLNSNYNKCLIERNTNVAHSFLAYIDKYFDKMTSSVITTTFGTNEYPMIPLASDYTTIGLKYHYVEFHRGDVADDRFFFKYDDRVSEIPEKFRTGIEEQEKKYGVLCGFSNRTSTAHFIHVDGTLTSVNLTSGEETFVGTMIDKLAELSDVQASPLNEWVDLKLLNKSIPVIFALSYRFGLSTMLKYCNVDFRLEEVGSRIDAKASDIIIRFQDKRLIISRTPQVNSLLFAGLNNFDLKNVLFEDMDDKNVYYDLIQTKGLSMNNIKGIDDFFDLFIDPMTRDILRQMREPTNVRDLLIRATTLLTTREHLPASSVVNYRLRGVEQITGIIYNELARAFATYRNRSIGAKRTWSISEYLIKQRIMTEQLMDNVSIINPIDDIKQYTKFSHAGAGGRQGESFRIPDRQYSADSMGTISEATVDNYKVGMNAIAPVDPIIVNARGMSSPPNIADLKPSNILSISSILMPCVTNDDSLQELIA